MESNRKMWEKTWGVSLLKACAAVETVIFILLLVKASDRSTIILLCIFFVMLLGIIFYTMEKMKQIDQAIFQKTEAQKKVVQIELEKKRQQLQALENQINPHFLYNTLDTFRGVALENGNNELSGMIEALSGMFKYSVNYETEMVNINGELNYLSKYLQIQQLRFPNRFTYQELNSCTTDLLLLESCPRLILQPIVENSINHGFAKMRKGGCITVSLEIRNQDFYIIVEDNGCGIPQDKVIRLNESLTKSYLETELENDDRHSGIGLINTNRRIKIFCGEEYGLKVISAPQVGTQVEICLPLYEEAKNEY